MSTAQLFYLLLLILQNGTCSILLTVVVLSQSSCIAPKLWGAGYGLDSAGSSRVLLETSLSAITAGNISHITHGGAESSVVLTSTGVLYSWGSNTYGIELCECFLTVQVS
jgi:hypothetical protein